MDASLDGNIIVTLSRKFEISLPSVEQTIISSAFDAFTTHDNFSNTNLFSTLDVHATQQKVYDFIKKNGLAIVGKYSTHIDGLPDRWAFAITNLLEAQSRNPNFAFSLKMLRDLIVVRNGTDTTALRKAGLIQFQAGAKPRAYQLGETALSLKVMR